MKYIFMCLFLFISSAGIFGQTQTAEQLKKKMAEIRRTTNWDNDAEAAKANAEIKKLSKQLLIIAQKKDTPQGAATDEEIEKDADRKSQMFDQIIKSAQAGEEADVLLADPIKEEIKEEYRDDESSTVKNPEIFSEAEMLCIDMSLKTVQRTIDQMKNYKSIKILVIAGGKNGAAVNLDDLLFRAANYPLEKLFIFNFKKFVTSIPAGVAKFKNLKMLSLFNNSIKKIPQEMSVLTSLKELDVDINPISTILSAITGLTHLENLGIAKTNIADSEVKKIKQLLPNCNVQVK